MASILIVDDSPEVRIALTATLEDAGHTVSEASDGRDVVEQAALIQPDAIVLDINMPDVDGITALRGLRSDPLTRGLTGRYADRGCGFGPRPDGDRRRGAGLPAQAVGCRHCDRTAVQRHGVPKIQGQGRRQPTLARAPVVGPHRCLALGRRQRVERHPAQYRIARVLEVVKRTGRNHYAVARFNRILRAIHPDDALTPGDVCLVLPGMRVVGAGLAGLVVVVKRDHCRHAVVRAEDRVRVIGLVLDYRFQYLLPE